MSVKGIIMDIMVLFDSFVQTLGLWPSLAISGRPTSRFWILWTFGENGEATSKRIGAVSVSLVHLGGLMAVMAVMAR